jgi:hypothetical protein
MAFARVGASDEGVSLGQSNFKSIVVDSAATKAKINASGILWKKTEQHTVDSITDYGHVVSAGGADFLVISYVRGDYNVYVNPCGITSWTSGSPESVLEAIWAGWRLNGKFSEADMKAELKNFYSTFYRHDLTDAEVNTILAGK